MAWCCSTLASTADEHRTSAPELNCSHGGPALGRVRPRDFQAAETLTLGLRRAPESCWVRSRGTAVAKHSRVCAGLAAQGG